MLKQLVNSENKVLPIKLIKSDSKDIYNVK